MNTNTYVRKTVTAAKAASAYAAQMSTKEKNATLRAMAKALRANTARLIAANRKDVAFARSEGLSASMIDRLTLNEQRVTQMASAVEAVSRLADPIGHVLSGWDRPNGLHIDKVSVPLGVILIIYEARPNVTSECASLCLKSGNAVILRGGKECFHTNAVMVKLFQAALRQRKHPAAIIGFVETTDRHVVDVLLKQDRYISLVMPRGGEGLIRKVVELSTIPVIKHYKGICHVFVDESASLLMALDIAVNAKCQRPSVCNAMETLLVHRKIAAKFLPRFAARFKEKNGVIFGCSQTVRVLKGTAKRATDKNYHTEYLDYRLSVKVVRDVAEAIAHINAYSSQHTDAIVSRNRKNIERFVREVDSSSVMVNASTRFSDGNEYGFGAEIGISTDKIHARGPMGLDGLTTYKYIVRGNGQVRG